MDVISFLAEKAIFLNEQQKEGVLSTSKDTLLLAVPGSGKTTVLVSRIAHLMLDLGLSPKRILTLTYSRETARDMRERFESLFGEGTEAMPRFQTIHSFCFTVLKSYAAEYSRPIPQLIEPLLKKKALSEIYRHYQKGFLAEENLEELSNLISYVKNMMLTKEQLFETAFDLERFPEIFLKYEDYKKEHHFIDFDDMLSLTLQIFSRFPAILERFQEAYDWILLDEAQDTSCIQHHILRLLSKKSRVFFVGDEDQTIYSFRGAYPQMLLDFCRWYPHGRVLKMEENYRSHRDIVALSNRFIKQSRNRYEKKMTTQNPAVGSVKYIKLSDYNEQYQYILTLCKALPEGKNLVVLYRNNESALPLIKLFYQENLSFYMREHKPAYFSCGVIRDILSYLSLARNPMNLEAFQKIYYKLGYSRSIFEFVKEHEREYFSILDTVAAYPLLSDYHRQITRRYQQGFKRLLRLPALEAVDFILEELNYNSFVKNRIPDGSGKAGIFHRISIAKALAGNIPSLESFSEYLNWLAYQLKNRKNINSASNIVFSTCHSAKGMEFDQVVLLDMIKGIFPEKEITDPLDEEVLTAYENEVRLFYVGVTRAKEKLFLFSAPKFFDLPMNASVFLSDFLKGPSAVTKASVSWEGKAVRHIMFGRGVVVSQMGDSLLIEFPGSGRKKFNRTSSEQNGFLRLEEEGMRPAKKERKRSNEGN